MKSQPSILMCFLSGHWANLPDPELQQNLWVTFPPPLHFPPSSGDYLGADLAKLLSLFPSKSQHIWSPAVVSIAQLSTAKTQSSESCCPMET